MEWCQNSSTTKENIACELERLRQPVGEADTKERLALRLISSVVVSPRSAQVMPVYADRCYSIAKDAEQEQGREPERDCLCGASVIYIGEEDDENKPTEQRTDPDERRDMYSIACDERSPQEISLMPCHSKLLPKPSTIAATAPVTQEGLERRSSWPYPPQQQSPRPLLRLSTEALDLLLQARGWKRPLETPAVVPGQPNEAECALKRRRQC